MRWLSKGNCFKRYYFLFDTVVQCLQANKCSDLSNDFLACKTDIVYLTDLFCISESVPILSIFFPKNIVISKINRSFL